MSEPEMVERVARAMHRKAYGTVRGWRSLVPEARAAIEAMRQPSEFVVVAIERKAEERYRAAPEMQRWYGDDVWNAGIDAALAEPTTPR